jgi:hypothetical protein
VIKSIREGSILDDGECIEKYIYPLKIPNVVSLATSGKYKCSRVKRVLEQIERKESNKIEGMVYRLMRGKEIEFTDIKTKILFYRDLSLFRGYFKNSKNDKDLQLMDLYFMTCGSDEFHGSIGGKETIVSLLKTVTGRWDRIFYIVVFREMLDDEAKELVLSEMSFDECWMVGISTLSEERRFERIGECLVESSLSRVEIVRMLGRNGIDGRKLMVFILQKYFQGKETLVEDYIFTLEIIPILRIGYRDRIDILCAWMDHFLVTRKMEEFLEINEKISEHLPSGYEIYIWMGKHVRRQTDNTLLPDVNIENMYSPYDIEKIARGYIG